jgi:hypothetical protein
MKTPVILLFFLLSAIQKTGAGFNIEKYHVTISISQNGVLDINEKIIADFYEKKHGIYRNIPLGGGYTEKVIGRGVALPTKLAISNISANQEMITWVTNNECYIRKGNTNVTVFGDVEYDFSYTVYGAFMTENESYDELYYNIIGVEWAVDIDHAGFEIIFPENAGSGKNIDYRIYYGKKGSDKTAQWIIDPYENKAVYVHPVKLNPYEGITVYIKFKKGYINIQK